MKSTLYKASSRGHANHGWLNSYHTFSFASYHDPERMHFGALRVLNDDTVEAGRGFSTHPHQNMEIISIPLEGDLKHMDSMGNIAVIQEGDIQVLSAGTGISHSEFNKNQDRQVKFLQIWIFPRQKDLSPRYDQTSIRPLAKKNAFFQILSPHEGEPGVWINQDAWFHMGELDKDRTASYTLKQTGNGVYVFVLEGKIEINGQVLGKRDGLGVWDISELQVQADEASKILLMEIPMNF